MLILEAYLPVRWESTAWEGVFQEAIAFRPADFGESVSSHLDCLHRRFNCGILCRLRHLSALPEIGKKTAKQALDDAVKRANVLLRRFEKANK